MNNGTTRKPLHFIWRIVNLQLAKFFILFTNLKRNSEYSKHLGTWIIFSFNHLDIFHLTEFRWFYVCEVTNQVDETESEMLHTKQISIWINARDAKLKDMQCLRF